MKHLLLILLIGTTVIYAQGLEKFFYIFGEGRAKYTTEDSKLNFILGDTDILTFISDGKNKALLEIYIEQPDAFVDVERAYYERRFGDNLFFRFGKLHTPLGYFHRTWHYGLHLMTPIDRPDIINFEDEGGPLPIHIVGFEIEGRTKLGGYTTGGILSVFNGNLHLGATNTEDRDKKKSLAGKLYVKPGLFSETGVSFIYDPVDVVDEDVGRVKAENYVLGVHYALRKPAGAEVNLEFYGFYEGLSEKKGAGGFGLLSYPFRLKWGTLRPYILVEFLHWDRDNPWFRALHEKLHATQEEEEAHELHRHIGYYLGLKYIISPNFSVKTELSYEDSKEGKNYWEWQISFGFGIPILR